MKKNKKFLRAIDKGLLFAYNTFNSYKNSMK